MTKEDATLFSLSPPILFDGKGCNLQSRLGGCSIESVWRGAVTGRSYDASASFWKFPHKRTPDRFSVR